jgi:hypothetical protein
MKKIIINTKKFFQSYFLSSISHILLLNCIKINKLKFQIRKSKINLFIRSFICFYDKFVFHAIKCMFICLVSFKIEFINLYLFSLNLFNFRLKNLLKVNNMQLKRS